MKKNKVVFISGSSSGLGFELAKLFSKENYIVIMNGRNKKKLLNSSKKILNSHAIAGDLANENNCKNIFYEIKKKFSKINLILCNAGIGNFKKTNNNIFFAFENNFFNTVNTINVLSPLLKIPFSNIICISSICGVENISGAPKGYSLAKSALNNYVKIFSEELAKKKIRINSVSPGNILFKKSIWEKKLISDKRKTINYINKQVPMKSFIYPKNVYDLIKFIIDKNNRSITGSNFVIDGGQTKNI
jgi:NAD(P)-dependent dehydrogenase (short-subunit alcohol dehydrogenase family)